MAKRKGEIEIKGVWELFWQLPRDERRDFIDAMKSMFRGKTVEELGEDDIDSSPLYDLPFGATECPACGGALKSEDVEPLWHNPDYPSFKVFDCEDCERVWAQDLQ